MLIGTAIEEFLNSMLDCPLPIDGLTQLADFLKIKDVSTENIDEPEETFRPLPSTLTTAPGKETDARTANDLLTVCQTQILRAENQNILTRKLAEQAAPARSLSSASTSLSFISSNIEISPYHEAMHTALIQAMEERDEARARLVTAQVLHVHEMDQQRKTIQQLESQLEDQKRGEAKSTPEKPKDPTELKRIERGMQQNSDAELVALCQQLGSEISGRTEAELEIVRLKESRKIERDSEQREKANLLLEIKDLKEKLAKEQQKTQSAEEASGSWKRSFQDIVQAKSDLG